MSGKTWDIGTWYHVIDDVLDKNNEIQSYIDQYGTEVPSDLIKLLSDLDWLVRTGTTQRETERITAFKDRDGWHQIPKQEQE